MRPVLPLVLLASGTLAACTLVACTPAAAPARPPDGGRAALMAADRAFAASVSREGSAAWARTFTPDAVRLYMGGTRENGWVVEGREAVARFDAELFADPATKILWAPTDGGQFRDDPRLGWTTGRSWFIRHPGSAAPDTVWKGRYLSLWRLVAPGRWEMLLDTGALDR